MKILHLNSNTIENTASLILKYFSTLELASYCGLDPDPHVR